MFDRCAAQTPMLPSRYRSVSEHICAVPDSPLVRKEASLKPNNEEIVIAVFDKLQESDRKK